jgi:hypothetical protein
LDSLSLTVVIIIIESVAGVDIVGIDTELKFWEIFFNFVSVQKVILRMGFFSRWIIILW